MEKSTGPASKLRDVHTLGLLVALVITGMGVHALVQESWPANLLMPFVFGVLGAAACFYGRKVEDTTVWGGGLIATALLTPNYFGLIPLGVVLILVGFAAFLAWKAR